MDEKKGYLMILIAGCLWGTIGLFGKIFFRYNMDSKLVVFCRLFVGFIIMCLYIFFSDKKLFKIDIRGLKYTAVIGFVTQSVFNILYFECIKRTTISTAVILLYTAPIFLIIMGRIFYKEKLSIVKIIALVLCITGSYLTVTGGSFKELAVNMPGVLMGIGAGFTYSLVTIISKAILDKYHPFTVILYSFLFGWLFLMPFVHPINLLYINYNIPIVFSIIGLGFIPTVLSYIFYIGGLSHKVEASKAGIICSSEIVISVLISCVFFKEVILGYKLLGVMMALCSIIIIQLDGKLRFSVKNAEVEEELAA